MRQNYAHRTEAVASEKSTGAIANTVCNTVPQ